MRTEAIPRSPSGDVGVRTGGRESARVRVRVRVRLGPTRPAGLGALRSTAAESVCRLSALGLLHPATSPRRALLLPPPMLSAASGLTARHLATTNIFAGNAASDNPKPLLRLPLRESVRAVKPRTGIPFPDPSLTRPSARCCLEGKKKGVAALGTCTLHIDMGPAANANPNPKPGATWSASRGHCSSRACPSTQHCLIEPRWCFCETPECRVFALARCYFWTKTPL